MTPPLRILVGPGLDRGTSWRHQLADDTAVSAWLATGPTGLVRQVALRAGVPATTVVQAERVAAAARALAELDDGARSFSRSRTVDPLGVARRMLALHDELRWAGWEGGPLTGSPLLDDLTALHALAPEGPADLAHRVLGVVAGGFDASVEVSLAAPQDELPAVVGRLLDLLGAACAPEHAEEIPKLVILEAETPGEAAELVAAWLVDHPAERRTLLVGSEGRTLRAALRCRGLPGIDATGVSRHRPELQVLPLRLALAFRPQDPRRALELLMLPGAPLPWPVRKELIDALNTAPGIGGPAWTDAQVRLGDAKGADAVDSWFGGELADPDAGLPAGRAAALCGHVTTWAGARGYDEAAGVAARLRKMLDRRHPDEALPRSELLRMHDEAVGGGVAGRELPIEAGGAAQCTTPASVLPGAQHVVWWGFVEGDSPAATAWTQAERRGLTAAGVSLAAPGAARAVEARTWRRALRQASDVVVLVRWRLSGAGACAPHPVMDELEVELGRAHIRACTVTAEQVLAGEGRDWSPQVVDRPLSAPTPGPALWQPGPELLHRATPESPSSIERMLNCSLAWTLQYPGRLRAGARASMPDGNRLAGTFMHALLQDLLLQDDPPTEPDDAARQAIAAFDARIEGEAAPLLMPGRGADRMEARRTVGRAAACLVSLLEAGGWRAVAAEEELGGAFAGGRWKGYADLVLERDPASVRAVVDLKLGRSGNRRAELANGRALQIALYAQGVSPPGAQRGPAGYFTLTDGRMLTVDAEAFPGAVDVQGDDLAETVALAEQGWRWWRSLLSTGSVAARPLLTEADEAVISEAATGELPDQGPAATEAGCKWCDFQGICLTGRSA